MALEERNARARRRLAERALAALIVGAVGVACSGSTFTGTDPEAGASGAAGSGGSSAGKGGRGGAGGKAGSSSGVGGATGGSAGKGSGGTDSTGGTVSSGGTGKGGTGGSTGGTVATGGTGDAGGASGGNGGSGNDSGNGGSGNTSGDGGTGNTSGQGGASAGLGGAGNTSGQGGSSAGTAGKGGGAGGTLGGTAGTLGGIGGSGNAAGTGGRAGAECQTASDCQLQTDCCTCAAEPKGKLLPACQSICVVDRCSSMQIGPSEVACVRGRCVIARSCDLSEVTCEQAQPACATGTIPSVDGTCFGPCLPPNDCSSVTSCADCADPDVCVRNEAQLASYGCVVPVAGCQAGSFCSCLGACMSPFNACMETSVQVNCSCPNC